MDAKERQKLMSLDQRTPRIAQHSGTNGMKGVAIDIRPPHGWPVTWYRHYLWRGPVTGKLYGINICDAQDVAFLRKCGLV